MRRIGTVLLLLLVFQALPARAETMTYAIYAGGIHVVDAQLDVNTGKGHYNIVLKAQTRGFLASLVPWIGTFESHGWVLPKNDNRPELHKSTTEDSDGRETKEYRYTKDGFKNLTVTDKKGKTKIRPSPAELTKGTIDSLTATLKILQAVAAGKECAGQSDIYDGQRRFTQVFHPQGHETLEPMSYNAFAGPTSVCTVEVVPKGGNWQKKPRGWMSIQEQGRKAGALPTLWVGQMEKGGPAVPVKIRIKTAYGTLFMYLAEYKNGAKIVTAERRK